MSDNNTSVRNTTEHALMRIAELIGKTDQPEVQVRPGLTINPGLEMVVDAETLRGSVRHLRQGLVEILVAGRFKNGKSTLVNAMLGAGMAPTDINPTTAVISRLVKGESLDVTVHRRSGSSFCIDWETFVRDYTLNSLDESETDEHTAAQRFMDVDVIEIAYPFPLLSEDVTIVDTPGIGEDRFRTAVALDYLPRAGAVIVVLYAKQLLSRDERNFIDLLGIGKLQHVFFVINKFDEIEESEHEQVRAYVRQRLTPYFTDQADTFDAELFAQRVFFTNAYQAVRAYADQHFDADAYAASGVGSLRDALMVYLRGAERHLSHTRALIPVLADILMRTRQTADRRLEALAQPLGTVQEHVQNLDTRLQRLQKVAEGLPIRVVRVGEVVQYQVYSNLVSYVDEMRQSWETDVSRLDFHSLAHVNFITARFNEQEKVRIARAFSGQLEHYLQFKLIEWAQQLPGLLRPTLEDLLRDIRRDVAALQLELDEIAGVVGSVPPVGEHDVTRFFAQDSFQNLLSNETITRFIRPTVEKTVSTIMRDDHFQDAALAVVRVFLQVAALFLGAGGKIVSSTMARVIDAVVGDLQRRRHTDRLMQGPLDKQAEEAFASLDDEKARAAQQQVRDLLVVQLKEPLFAHIQELLHAHRELIFESVCDEFAHIGAELGTVLQRQIEDLHAAQQRLLAYRESQQFSLESERLRLVQIDTALREQFASIAEQAMGYTPSDEQIAKLAHLRTTFIKQHAQSSADPVAPTIPDVPLPPQKATVANNDYSAKVLSTRLVTAITTAFGLHGADFASDSAVAGISERLANLIGMDAVKSRVLELMDYQVDVQRRRASGMKVGEPPSLHLVFTGNPGTGKTTVAEIIGEIYQKIGVLKQGHVIKTRRAELVGAYTGHTEKRVLAAINKAIDGVLFIDEAHQLAIGDEDKDFGRVVIRTLLEQMEPLRDRLVVIVAGYPKEMERFLNVDPGLRGRFPVSNIIHFSDYTPPELLQILRTILRASDHGLSPEAEQVVEQVIAGIYQRRDEQFGNARAMRDLAQDMLRMRAVRLRSSQAPLDDLIRPEDIDGYYKGFVHAPTPHESDEALKHIEAMIGLDAVKSSIREFMAFARRSQRLGESLWVGSLHMLFRGTPGTGKTTVAKHYAAILHALGYLSTPKLTIARRQDFVGEHIGKTEPKTMQVLQGALDGVLFIDEAYTLYVEHAPNDYGRIVLNLLNDFMEEHRDRLIVILAGYRDALELLLDANDGLRSRFAMSLDFADYSNDELLQIARKFAAEQGFTMSTKVEVRITHYLERLRLIEGVQFGNARSVRQMLDAMQRKLALRLDQAQIADEAEFYQRSYIFEETDVPPLPEAPPPRVIIQMTESIDIAPLNIRIEPHAADRSR